MSKVIWHITMSLDGFISGPDDSMDWAFDHGDHSHIAEDTMNEVGAIAPVLVGDGISLYGGPGAQRIDLQRTEIAYSGQTTDIVFRVRK